MKSPAFQLYANDFLGSAKVGVMSVDEVGAYWLLLLLDWQEGGFTFDRDALAQWCRMTPERFEVAWKRIEPCFKKRRGRLTNPRLEKERVKQKNWRTKSRTGGVKSGETRRKAAKGGCDLVGTKRQPNANTPLPFPFPVKAVIGDFKSEDWRDEIVARDASRGQRGKVS